MGMRLAELPIPWYFNPESKLNLVQDTIKMVTDLLTMRRNARLGLYDTYGISGPVRTAPEDRSKP
jgi:hypothetical protein